jgi:hypothetical protein
MKLSDREMELLEGMIEVQLNNRERCEYRMLKPNASPMYQRQRAQDQERIDLLLKIQAENS